MTAVTTVPVRRTLRFSAIDEALADVDALAAAERSGTLRRSGNWSFGQNLNHLATWADYAYDGVPMKIPAPVRWVARPFRRLVLYRPMRPGAKIPRVPGGTLAIDDVDPASAVPHFRRSFARLRDEPPTLPHALFGALTHDEWIAQHLRHAELHLSFLRAD